MSVGWVYHRFLLRHLTGPEHPEQPARLRAVAEGLEAAGLLDRMEPLPFGPATFDELCRIHEPAYVALVRLACEEGFRYIGDPETHLSPESYDAASLAAGGVLAACDAVMAGRVKRAFCAVRPPGHHAGPDRARGYCLFNHVALAAEHLIRTQAVGRVAVVDFDVHHGNGTQEIFEERDDVLYLSLHEHPLSMKFPGTGYRAERGRGAGAGCTANVYLPHGAGDDQLRRTFEAEARPVLEAFAPRFVLLSAGFDAQGTEPRAHLNLTPGGFGWLTRRLVDVADRHASGRLVSVLEGGYELAGLARCVTAHVAALLGGSSALSP